MSGRDDHALTVFNRNDAGALTYSATFQDPDDTAVAITGAGAAQGIAHASGVIVSPDGKSVYVIGKGDNALAIFTRDNAGALTYKSKIANGDTLTNGKSVDGFDGAIDVAISPDGKNVYVVSDSGAMVVLNRVNSEMLTYSVVFKEDVGGVDGLDGAFGVVVSPDGENVYATGGTDEAVVVFTRDISGALKYVSKLAKNDQSGAKTVKGLDRAYGVVVSPDGKRVYVTGKSDNAIVTFTRKLKPQVGCQSSSSIEFCK